MAVSLKPFPPPGGSLDDTVFLFPSRSPLPYPPPDVSEGF